MNYLPREAQAALTGTGDKFKAITWLRRTCDVKLLESVLRQLPLEKPEISKLLFGQIRAQDWKHCVFPRQNSTINTTRAIQWHVASFSIFAETIKSHIKNRDAFVAQALFGNWASAEMILSEHQTKFGKSIWSLAQYFLLEEEKAGATANKNAREQFSKSMGKNIIGSIAACLSIRAEKTCTLDHFDLLMRNFAGENIDGDIKVFLRLLLTPQPVTLPRNLEGVLGLLDVVPLVDRFELFCRLALLAVAQNHADARRFSVALESLAKLLDDSVLHCAAETIACNRVTLTPADGQMLEIWDSYTSGDYERCVCQAEAFAKSHPLVFQAHELLVKSLLYSKRSPTQDRESPLASFWHHLFTIFDKGELTEDSLTYLGSLALRLNEISVSWPLIAVCDFHSKHALDDSLLRLSAFVQRVHGPRNVEHGFSNKELVTYETALRRAAPNSVAVRFLHAVTMTNKSELEALKSSIPRLRFLFFQGISALRQGDYSCAVTKLKDFLALSVSDGHPSSPFAVEEARIALAGLFLLMNNAEELQQIVSDAYLERPHSVKRFPLGAIYKNCYAARKNIGGNISFPLVAYLASDESHNISLALKVFLAKHSIEKPTELQSIAARFPAPLLATFLLKVCTLDVIDSLICLTSTSEVEAERIAILNWLSKLQPAWASIVQTEVLRITEAAELREALEWIEVSRVAVNLPGMKEAEELKFREAFLRFAAYRELIPHISNISLTPLGYAGHTAVYSVPEEDMRRIISAQDGEVRLLHIFSDAFNQVLDVFLNSPQFGLDACLSVRIRHGILAQHIRRPFSENRLFIDPSDSKATDVIAYWTQLEAAPVDGQNELLAILTALSQRVLEIIAGVKDSWIQVSTVPDGDALFNYSYSASALVTAFERIDFRNADYTQFLDGIFNELLDRTRVNLTAARRRIESQLTNELEAALGIAEGNLLKFSSSPRYGHLRDAISRCKSDVERSVQTMQRWFKGADASLLEDVTFDMAANTAIGMANRLYPGVKNQIADKVLSEFKLQGRYFSGFVHLLFFLIENALRHSGLQLADQNITVVISAKNSIVKIEVTNKLSDTKDWGHCAQIVNNKIAEVRAKRDYSKARSEGGSGIAKIIAALVLEFGSDNYDFFAGNQRNLLTVTAEFDATQIMK